MNAKGVCRTAPATVGLLNILVVCFAFGMICIMKNIFSVLVTKPDWTCLVIYRG